MHHGACERSAQGNSPHKILVVGFWTLETRKLHEEEPRGSSEGDEADVISSNDSRVGRVDAVSTADPTFCRSFRIHQLARHGNVHFACAVSVNWTLPRGDGAPGDGAPGP